MWVEGIGMETFEIGKLRRVLDATRHDMRAGFAVIIFFLVLLLSNSFHSLR